MQLYTVAPGHDVFADHEEVEAFNDNDIQYPDFLYAGDGSVIPIGAPFFVLTIGWHTYAQWALDLAKFGLSPTVFSANCTIYAQNDSGAWSYFNAIASHQTGKQRSEGGGLWLDTEITISRLAATTPP